eukprot:CAMPEP_0201542534 /NCGR_PEP_ID=MMETSP0161_2-20130828/72089_1 /ASSEMBLY_ACC=CAM_ASM_000251 /TAXON_ID=180227 /ORGANISM="Neoparamoeba aestuarina, Strain SoJaBio B1-5/56/2" /LENGTH=255 /DNA_ID=CAMNT_0047950195 /DNA_START=486 /DNA_END=1253 /DNA_ORIENTATION=-
MCGEVEGGEKEEKEEREEMGEANGTIESGEIKELKEKKKEEEGEQEEKGKGKEEQDESLSYEQFFIVCRGLLSASTTKKLRKLIVSNQGPNAVTISDDLLLRMAKFVDKDERGYILLSDLVVAFRFVEMKWWRKQVLQRITSEFFHNRYRLMRAFRCFEFDELHGKIGQEGFKAGLRAINIILDKKALSDKQIESLHEALDRDGDGYIDYEEFLDFFRVYDVQKEFKRQQKEKDAKRAKKKRKERKRGNSVGERK